MAYDFDYEHMDFGKTGKNLKEKVKNRIKYCSDRIGGNKYDHMRERISELKWVLEEIDDIKNLKDIK